MKLLNLINDITRITTHRKQQKTREGEEKKGNNNHLLQIEERRGVIEAIPRCKLETLLVATAIDDSCPAAVILSRLKTAYLPTYLLSSRGNNNNNNPPPEKSDLPSFS